MIAASAFGIFLIPLLLSWSSGCARRSKGSVRQPPDPGDSITEVQHGSGAGEIQPR
jgi:hypothetical protein